MRTVILALPLLMGFIHVFPQTQNHSAIVSSEYVIDIPFQIANYDVVDTALSDIYGVSQTFSTIIMGDENYGVVDSLGFPLLPRYVFDLQVPINSSQYTASVILPEIDSFYVSYSLLPALNDIRKDSAIYAFNMDTLYYSSNNCFVNIGAAVFDEYKVFGEKGITVSVIPFEYRPSDGMVRVLTAGKIRISYTLNPSLISRDTPTHRATKAVEEHLSNLFCNYETRQSEGTSENYLIITHPQFENSISYFADYKRKIGYNVTVANTNTTGESASSIISYLKSKYNNLSTRPEYVLLVGSPSLIPVSAGTSTDIDDPATDLFYALLDGDDYVADVFLGRMPVSNVQEVQNVINKTIFMEMNLRGMDKKATFIAGQEDNNFMENLFEKGHNYVIPHGFQPKGYQSTKLYQPNNNQVQQYLSNNPLYFVYSGHGSINYWAGISFKLIVDSILTAHNMVYPFPFAFACHTGNFTNDSCMANKWMLSNKKGSATYFGSSVSTCCHSDYIIEKKIFGSDFTEDKTISFIINRGMNSYRKYFWARFARERTKRYMKSYNLLGDPSLLVGGIGCINSLCFHNNQHYYSGEYTEYHVASTISHDDNFVVNSGASIHLFAGEEIILTDGFSVSNGGIFVAKIEDCAPDDLEAGNNVAPIAETRANRTTAVETVCTPSLQIFPNPANSTVTLQLSDPQDEIRQITVANMQGQVMLSQTVNATTPYTLDISSLPAGIYVMRVLTANGQALTGKVVKE